MRHDLIIVAIFSAIVTALGAYFVSLNETQSTNLDAVYDRIAILEKRITAQDILINNLQSQLLISETENARLQLKLDMQLDANKIFQTAFNGIQRPVWMKKVVELEEPNARGQLVEFRMALINETFASEFRVSSYAYEGRTDYEIWSEEIADMFYARDIDVFRQKSQVSIKEFLPENVNSTILVEHRVDKSILKLPHNGGWAIVGISYNL